MNEASKYEAPKKLGGHRVNAGRKSDPVRRHFEERIVLGSGQKFRCVYCKTDVSGKACRLSNHLTKCEIYKKQNLQHNSPISPKSPGNGKSEHDSSRKEAMTHMTLELEKENLENDVYSQYSQSESEMSLTSVASCSSVGTEKASETRASVAIKRPSSNSNVTPTSKQQKLSKFCCVTNSKDKERIDMALARYFFSCNVPFHHVEKKCFRNMLATLRPGYSPPNRKALANDLLNKVHAESCEEASRYLKGKSVTLVQDGWSAIHNDPVIANCVSDGKKSFFLSSVDSGSNKKTSEYCLKIAKEAIFEAKERFGCTVRSFVSDNEAKMCKMRDSLQEVVNSSNEFYFISYGCSAHYLNLLAGDICKLKNVKSILEQVKELSKYFRNHHDAKGLLAQFKGSRIPQLPGETRWNSAITCLEVYVINRDFYLKIADENEERIDTNICKIIQNIGLFKEVKRLINQLKPIGVALDKLQGESATLSDCMAEFLCLKNKSKDGEVLEPYDHLLQKRFDDCITPNHILAFMLDPKRLQEDLPPELEEQARFFLSQNINPEFLPLLVKFRLKASPFPASFFEPLMLSSLQSIEWWGAICKINTIPKSFSEFAMHLQGCIASSASIERIFSNMSFVQSKLRNRLGLERASKLVMTYRMLNATSNEKEPYSDEEYEY